MPNMYDLEELISKILQFYFNPMTKSKCPICGRYFSDILKHFVLKHDIKDMNQLQQIINKKAEFRAYVEELKQKRKKGEISAEDYRRLVMKWCREH